ncbi:kinesin-associated protein 3-like protein [Dinothrombium tinctorium]|uniref:Kinesin-associated protein 3-like protein n=1 Tax=Dinothrombium tinctorium TaxID=1965070 RepID=A0A3S3NXE1_9ACAR|nr:kinesin-associated protein 3-like protein [Dinothrombium tinctorium]
MDPDEVKCVQRRITAKSIDCHPTENALIVNCEIEASLMSDDLGDYFIEKSKECQKIIRLQSLEQSSDADKIAEEVIKKSGNLISFSQIEEVKQIINYLKKRKAANETATGAKIENFRPKTASNRKNSANSKKTSNGNSSPSHSPFDSLINDLVRDLKLNELTESEPSINSLDNYIELLYEEFHDKIKGAAYLFYLATNSDNLSVLTSNETLICALARVLREDGRKNLDLSTFITATFACFSVYSQFHSVISQFKVGSICFDLIHLELEREEAWFSCSSMSSSLISSTMSISSAPEEVDSGFSSLSNKYQKALKRYHTMVRKQDVFIRVALYLLYNLSQDPKLEYKMVNKGIIVLITKTLERDMSPELLLLIANFLKKLSVFKENIEQFNELLIVEKLYSIFSTSLTNRPLLSNLLHTLFNLSFDTNLRNQIVKSGYLPKFIQLLAKSQDLLIKDDVKVVYEILYHLSKNEKFKGMFTLSISSGIDFMQLIVNQIFKLMNLPSAQQEENHFMQIMALSINLVTNRRNAQLLCENGQLQRLIDRAIKASKEMKEMQTNILLLKLIRNISQHDDPFKMIFLDYVENFVKIVVNHKCKYGDDLSKVNLDDFVNGGDFDEFEEMFVVETLGILGNLSFMPQINWLHLFKKFSLFDWIKIRLKPGSPFEDDVILDCVILLGTACSQPECCRYLVDQDCSKILIDLLNAKQEDDEIVLQIIYVFHLMSIDNLINDSQIPAYLIDLMNDKNAEIKMVCNTTLDILSEYDPSLADKILIERFKSYNKEWLEMVQSQQQMDIYEDSGSDLYNQTLNNTNLSNFLLKSDFLTSEIEENEKPKDISPNSELTVKGVKVQTNCEEKPAISQRPQTGYKKR